MPRTEFKQVDLDAAIELAPELADVVVNVATGHDAYIGKAARLWVSDTAFAQLDELFAVDADACDRCHVAILDGVGEKTCYERVCPECWDDEPRPCHRDCFE